MIRIAIDGYPITSVKGGIGYYVDSIVNELASRYKDEVQLIVLLPDAENISNTRLLSNPYLSVRYYKNPIRSEIFWSLFVVPIALLREKCDVFLGLSQYIPLRLSNYATFLFVHDYAYSLYPNSLRFFRRNFLKLLMPIFLKKADFVVFNSQATADRLSTIYPHIHIPSPELIVRPPVRLSINDSINCQPVAQLNRLKDKVAPFGEYVFSLLPLEPRKNIPLLLYTYSAYLDLTQSSDVRSLIIAGGPGWNSSASRRAIKYVQSRHPSKFLKLDFLDDQQYSYLLGKSSAFLFLSEYEGYGMPVSEALTLQPNTYYTNIPEIVEAANGHGFPIDLDALGQYTKQIFSNIRQPTPFNTCHKLPLSSASFTNDLNHLFNLIAAEFIQ